MTLRPCDFDYDLPPELIALPIADVLREAWDSEHVWYYAEEIFRKENNAGRTVWHPDKDSRES